MRSLFSFVTGVVLVCASSLIGVSGVIEECAADYRDLYREGKYAEALTALEQSPEAAQKSSGYYFNRGIIHHALNQEGLAVAYLAKAKAMDASADEVDRPLAEATNLLAKWLGSSRLDATSWMLETWGDQLPLDLLFLVFGALSVLSWLGFFLMRSRRSLFMRLGFSTLALAAGFGFWSAWQDQHPVLIVTTGRTVKSGPGESFLDRGTVEAGMKLRVVGEMHETTAAAPGPRWWKVRFNEKHDLGFIPEQSGLLLIDESNTPSK